MILEFSPNTEMSRVGGLADELFEHVLHDDEPLFKRRGYFVWRFDGRRGRGSGAVPELLRCFHHAGRDAAALTRRKVCVFRLSELAASVTPKEISGPNGSDFTIFATHW